MSFRPGRALQALRLSAALALFMGLALGVPGCATDATVAPAVPASAAAVPAAVLAATAASTPACTPAGPVPPSPAADANPDEPPPAPREFRAAWVATVANIDWPSRPGLPADAARTEALALLDRARAIGLNTLILQVRPAGDAIYPSALEPWSEFLTGAQGRAPEPPWDPLAFWVAQAHARGLQLEAWFNPYRARASTARTPLALPHLAVRQPGLALRYGDQLWFDPGEPDAAAQTLAVVADVVRRYDIDGVHIDDYFYPYPVSAGGFEQSFPDGDSYARYRRGGGTQAPDEWRRANVDALVQALYRTVHEIKPWLRFGISPFGLVRPEHRPPGVTGFDQFDKLHADVEHWLEQGWLDYLAPQLYWPLASPGQPFGLLLDTWSLADTSARALWPGLYTSQVGRTWPAQELLDQIALLRQRAGAPAASAGADPGACATPGLSKGISPGTPPSGHIHFSMVALMQDRDGIAGQLERGPYAQAALVPVLPWLTAAEPAPLAPRLRRDGGQVLIEPAAGAEVARWAVWRRAAVAGATWRFAVLPAAMRTLELGADRALVVSAVDRSGQLSPRAELRLP